IVEQADATDDIGLVVTDDEIPTDIDIAFADGVEDVERGDTQIGQFSGIYGDLIGLDAAAEAHDIADAGHRTELAVDDPVLHGLEFPVVADAAFERIAEDLAGRPCGRLNLRLDILRQGDALQKGIHLCTGILVYYAVVEDELHIREAEDARRAKADLLLHGIHRDLDRDRDELFDLFRAASGPLGNDAYFGIGHVGEGLDGHVTEGDDTGDQQDRRTEIDEVFVL